MLPLWLDRRGSERAVAGDSISLKARPDSSMKNARPIRVLVVFGTRPEAIKLFPVIREFRSRRNEFETTVCVTGQHREMLAQALSILQIMPDYNLDIMRENQTIEHVTSRVLLDVSRVIEQASPDVVVVQGDTTSAFAASLAAFYRKVRIAHVEAGLRTSNKYNPFPEEINRKLTAAVTDFHFAPTPWARDNLRKEGYPDERIFVVGNTVIDALMYLRNHSAAAPEYERYGTNGRRMILVTGHRRESFGPQFENICHALRQLSMQADVEIVFPVHLNPNVREPVFRILGGHDNIHLIAPVEYVNFVQLLQRCYFVLTDSGGIQEEAPSFKKPVLVMREISERPEGIQTGVARLVGTSTEEIVARSLELLQNERAYQAMQSVTNPYGDGQAARRIADILAAQCH